MKTIHDDLALFFSQLGFTSEETHMYLSLTQHGIQTILELSRRAKISRTRVYRLLETMKEKGLVEEITDVHRRMVKAIDVRELERLLMEKKQALQSLESLFPSIQQSLNATVGQGQSETRVQFYRGRSGLRQMVWHTLRAHHEVVGYTYRVLTEFIGDEFARDWRDAFVNKGLVFRDIYSDEYIESKKERKESLIFPANKFPSRYISSKQLNINLQTDFYNDVSAIYTWSDKEVFGIEIYNAKIAGFHKQLFEIIWQLAKP